MSFVSIRLLLDRFYVLELFVPYRFVILSLRVPLSYMAGSYWMVYQELWWRRSVKDVVCVTWFVVCAVEYEAPAVLCNAPFSYCKIDACKINGDRTNNTESTCKFTAGNAQY